MTALQLCYAIAMLSRITAASWRASHRCWDQINGNWWHDIFFGWDSLVDETDLRCVSWKELCKCIWTLLLLFMQANLLDVKRCQKGLLIFRMKLHPHVWISGFGITMSFDCVHWPVFQVTGAMTNLASNWFVGEPCPTPHCRPSHSLSRLSLIQAL